MEHKVKALKIPPPTPFNYLNWDEFLLFYNCEFDELEKDLELARDRFCFCCATSLRHTLVEGLLSCILQNVVGQKSKLEHILDTRISKH